MVGPLLVSAFTMGNVCKSGKTKMADPDSAWKQQNLEMKNNPMYKLADLAKEGELIREYEKVLNESGRDEAEKAIRKLAREKLEPFLYSGGKGKKIYKSDYIRWEKCCVAKLTGASMDNVYNKLDSDLLHEYTADRFNVIPDVHEVCWDLDKRGGVGETPFHLLYLMDSLNHTEVANILLDMYPKLALDFYEGGEYYGESSLHIAIVNSNVEVLKLLVERGANVNQRATGQFFLPEDQKKGKRKKGTNYEGYAYYGEYPLAFAACFGNREIYDYLLDNGANPDLQDSFGNTVLHMTVIANQSEMYKYAFRHHKRPATPAKKNSANLTPLTLASKLGRHKIFLEMLELSSIEMWRYSNITCSVYPMAALDTISPEGETNWESALWFIINGETDEHLDMLAGGVIRQLLDEKWKTFAGRQFIQRLIIALFHLLMISIAVYLRPAENLLHYRGPVDVVRFIAETVMISGCALTTGLNVREIYTQGIKGFLRNCKHAPAKTVFMFSCILLLLCIPCRLLSLLSERELWEQAEDTILIISVPCAWFFLLFFARITETLGPFIVMLYVMLSNDFLRVLIIYIIFLIQFSQGFYFLFRDIEDKSITSFDTLPSTVMTLIQMTLGEFRYEEFDYTHYAVLTKVVFGFFMVLVPILLLNMLIAMMGNTYQQVISKSEKEWRKQWAKIVIVLERAFSPDQLKKFQEKYSIPLPKPDTKPVNENDVQVDVKSSEAPEYRGLMVIKSCSKTKAKQRKGAVSNWKKLGREVMRQIKQQKREGKRGPLELKSRRQNSRHKRSHSRGSNNDRPSSGDSGSFGVNISSAVEQLQWERNVDFVKGQSLEKHVSQMSMHVDGDEGGNSLAMDEQKPPAGRRHRQGHKTPTDSPKGCRAQRNQVQPMQESPQRRLLSQRKSPQRRLLSPRDSPLISIPMDATLEISTIGDSDTLFMKSSKVGQPGTPDSDIRPRSRDSKGKVDSPTVAKVDDGYSSSLGSAGSKGPTGSEVTPEVTPEVMASPEAKVIHESPKKRRDRKEKHEKKEKHRHETRDSPAKHDIRDSPAELDKGESTAKHSRTETIAKQRSFNSASSLTSLLNAEVVFNDDTFV